MANLPIDMPHEPAVPPRTLAPVWHTVVLIVGILVLSISGSSRLATMHGSGSRMVTYASTALLEIVNAGLGSARAMAQEEFRCARYFGAVAGGFRGFALDLGIAFCSGLAR